MTDQGPTTPAKMPFSQDWLESLPTPSFIFSMESHRFLSANQRFLDLLGYSESELARMTVFDIRPAKERAQLEHALSGAPPEGTTEWCYMKKSGELIKVRIRYRNMNHAPAAQRFEAARFVAVFSYEVVSN